MPSSTLLSFSELSDLGSASLATAGPWVAGATVSLIAAGLALRAARRSRRKQPASGAGPAGPAARRSDPLEATLSAPGMATFEWDLVSGTRTWSEGVKTLFRAAPESVRERDTTFLARVVEEDRAALHPASSRLGYRSDIYEADYRTVGRGDAIQHLTERGKVHYDAAGRPVRIVGVCWDSTDLKRKEQRLSQLNRTLRALKESSQAMLRARTEAEYLQQVCTSVIGRCGYALVWIGFAEHDEQRTVRPVAHSGFEEGYLRQLKISWADNEVGRGPTGTAIRTGRPSVCRNMLTDPKFLPWRAEATKRGYASSISVPLLHEGRAFGSIAIYSRQPDSFLEDEVELLTELAEGVVACIHSLRAVEERRRAEERLQLLSTVVESAANGIAVTDRDAQILWVNPAFTRLTGYTREEVVGKTPRLLKSGQHSAEFYHALWATLLKGDPWHGELVNRTKDGSLRREEMTITPVKASGAEITHFVAIKQDITERKRAERRTALLGETASRLLRTVHAETVIPELAQKVLGFLDCDVCLFFVARPPDRGLALHSSTGLSAEQCDQLRSLDPCAAMCGGPARDDCRLVARNIQEADDARPDLLRTYGVRAYACHPLTVGGVVLGTLSFGSRRRAHFTQDEISFIQTWCDLIATSLERTRLTSDLARAKEAAERANLAKDDFLAALSHELRTPLTPVLVLAEEAAADPSMPPAARAVFDSIVTNVRLEARLIDDLLDLSRIQRGKLALELQPYDTHIAVRDAIGTVERDAAQKHLAIELRLTADETLVAGDPVRLRQIFWNVLRNAVKFTPQNGRVSVETRTLPNRRIQVVIADSGIGMTAAELQRIFESFSQGDHAGQGGSHRFGGLGLGLAISRSLVSMHGGTIRAESDGVNRGARFTIELPLLPLFARRRPQPVTTPGQSTAEPARDAAPARRILLVEDHEATRVALAALLRRRGHDVTAVGCAADARAVSETGTFDLLMSDLGLPDGTGYELVAELRRRHRLQAIALTGYGRDEDLTKTREAGFTIHLTKPVSVRTLEAALMAINDAPEESGD